MDTSGSLGKVMTQLIKKLDSWGVVTVKMLPNLLVAIIVMVIIVIVSRPIAKLTARAVLRFSGYRHIARLMGTITRLALITVGLVLALDVLNLDRAVASLLAGVGILGIAFGFASQDIAANFMSGILLHFVHPFRIDDLIRSGEFFGYVEAIDMRSTQIRSRQGQRITIPNKQILNTPIINFTITGVRRVDLPLSICYSDDLQKVEDLIVAAVESLELRNRERPVELFYEQFNGTSINFKVRFWTRPEQRFYLQARSDAIKAIDQIFKTHGLTLPSQNVSVDFGITGGPSLREQLEGVSLALLPPADQAGGKRKDNQENDGPKSS